ncbi:hypothetical protein JW868_01425 [Candidatus Woesearchaeota archaeon]|nr:hypothetical protein [Candidatus Woesearchaeota archaeon]
MKSKVHTVGMFVNCNGKFLILKRHFVFYTRVPKKFAPKLSKEHTEYNWITPAELLKTDETTDLVKGFHKLVKMVYSTNNQ